MLVVAAAGCGAQSRLPAAAADAPHQSPVPRATPTVVPARPSPLASPSQSPPQPALPWLTFGGSTARLGAASGGGAVHAPLAVGWRSVVLDGVVHAQPLVFDNRILVATESNSVYALAPADGHVLWTVSLGTPVTTPPDDCSTAFLNGIDSTPAIDPATATLYVSLFAAPGHHLLDAVDARTGALRWSRVVDPAGDTPGDVGTRPALTLAGGRVYIAFGGRTGDCGAWHGHVEGVALDGSGPLLSYDVPTQRWGGVWAPPGIAVEADGSLLVVTGNGNPPGTETFDGAEAMLHLTPTLQLIDWWQPPDVTTRDAADSDVGSTGPILLDRHRGLLATKGGHIYLFDPSHLGGAGGEISDGSTCRDAVGASAYSVTDALAFLSCTNGLEAVHVGAGGELHTAWHVSSGWVGPPLVANGAVWAVDVLAGVLHVISLPSGQELAAVPVGPVQHFTGVTPAGAEMIVATDKGVVAVPNGSAPG